MGVNLDAVTACFAPVSLAELEQRASLQTRVDRKYVVDLETFEGVARALAPQFLALEVAGKRVTVYDTVYFDTPSLLSYRQHRQGKRRRFKCRTRLYGSSVCFFEVKLKGRRNETVKRRMPIGVEEHGVFTDRANAFLEHELRCLYGYQAPERLDPGLRTTYARLTLVARSGAERLTCDFALGFSGRGAARHRIRSGRVLLETKSERGRSAADELLRNLGERPVASCSKYCIGVALAHPELSDNPFRRILRRDFRPASYEHPREPQPAAA